MHTEFIPVILSGFERPGSFSPSTKASILTTFRLFLVKAYSNMGINDKHKKKLLSRSRQSIVGLTYPLNLKHDCKEYFHIWAYTLNRTEFSVLSPPPPFRKSSEVGYYTPFKWIKTLSHPLSRHPCIFCELRLVNPYFRITASRNTFTDNETK